MIKKSVVTLLGLTVMGSMLAGCGVSAPSSMTSVRGMSMSAKSEITGTKRALMVGINDYTYINDLSGCVNDINDVKAQVLMPQGYKDGDVVTLLDAQATRANILAELNKVVAESQPGDFVYFHYSGHGSQIKDTNGDEPEGKDEILCPVDIAFSGGTLKNAVVDDEIQSALGKLKPGVGMLFVSDSCNSGTVDRAKSKVRGVNFPSNAVYSTPVAYNRTAAKTFASRLDAGKYTFISGCQDTQTSADAFINGRYNGALTYFFLDALKKGGMNQTYRELHKATVDGIIAGRYTQRPNLQGEADIKVFTIAN